MNEEKAPDEGVKAVTESAAEELGVPAPRAALVKDWLEKLSKAKKHWDDKKVFERMLKCQRIAKDGTSDKAWADSGSFVVPIIMRHINQAVGTLYAKNPTATAKRRPRQLFAVWDGKSSTITQAMEAFQSGDVSYAALLTDIVSGQEYMRLADRVARTVEILWQYFMSEQEHDYKTQLKALVRRAKVNGVAYVELGFQRQTGNTPEMDGKIADCRSKIAKLQQLMDMMREGNLDAESKELEELNSLLADLTAEQSKVYREGPVLTFPRSTTVVPSIDCQHLKSFLGASFVSRYIDLTPEEGKIAFGVDVSKYGTKLQDKGGETNKVRFWYVQDKVARQFFVVAEGYPDFIKAPATPDVKIERFFTIFALVFNEAEDEENPFPVSDVWACRHTQDEYNRSREGLRQHRIANRPWYAVRKGALEETDRTKLASHESHAVIEFNGLGENDKIEDIVQRGPSIAIDPEQYDTEIHMADLMRTVGVQQANLGPTSGATATESSIAENSRMSGNSDNVDDLDDLLTQLARAGGQLLLAEMSKEQVIEIVGPGAAWPDLPASREEIQKDLMLEIEAGSSGRPNKSAELADLERATPAMLQVPGFNPEVIAKKYVRLLDLDPEEAYVEGLPSITAINAAMSKTAGAPQPSTGDPATDPAQQGVAGAQNAPAAQAGPPGAQPAYPAPAQGNIIAQNA